MKLLLFNLGLSNIGDWIFLIAFNLIVLEMTGSPLAVAVLYMLKPAAALLTNVWSGGMIDRVQVKHLLMWLDAIRGALLIVLPFMSSLIVMYGIVLVVNMASAVFNPASMVYMTRFFEKGERLKFNAWRSLVDSGGFLFGPAVAGLFFMIGSPWIAIVVNAVTFFISAALTGLLPRVSTEWDEDSLFSVKEDWKLVIRFSRHHVKTMIVYSLFSLFLVMTAAIDSLEAAFSKEVLDLSNAMYGFLVSLAGAGIITGAAVQTLLIRKVTERFLMGAGSLCVASGYLIYAFSSGVIGAAIGFFTLSFSLAFANTGFLTFYQNEIPASVMGRVGSLYDWAEAFIVILSVAVIGLLAEVVSIRTAVMTGGFLMLFITFSLILSFKTGRKEHVLAS
ncbi:MFS transporter [Halobacillus litoralis]|uniref:MFS transporter n=1 Tax=Halobacillus litoralis TaxID=45668 RepID=UPI001CD4B018|nr:MFS transporter [Halobacillus litoralis]MCA0969284.1 MFS transporter [Halobacillus litoralis]